MFYVVNDSDIVCDVDDLRYLLAISSYVTTK